MTHTESMRQYQFDLMFMDMAHLIARVSHCKKHKVGAVLVKDREVISMGYNGTPAGQDNTCEDQYGLTKECVIHAEVNAIKRASDCKGATMYVTHAPCIYCAIDIVSAGIKEIVYFDVTSSGYKGLEHLHKAGKEVMQLIHI
jgi:dCMP deaminase